MSIPEDVISVIINTINRKSEQMIDIFDNNTIASNNTLKTMAELNVWIYYCI